MGNREDLLDGARRCLLEKGYARTTARDIAQASGVSLAAIGYHFGSKDVLLHEALRGAIEEWGDRIAAAMTAAASADADPAGRFEATWASILDAFAETRPLWAVQFEVLAHIERTPELRRVFAAANRQARLGLAELFGVDAETLGPDRTERIGAYLQALLSGTAAQWLLDPGGVPSAGDLLDAVRTFSAALGPYAE
ncbi:TetR/AcrR family transcriptional regulator [Actinoallomurus iriomotensis]|uniref:TetR family transcriptional regulator n=1 Tax=Actinoallomurus iriomotensis TaxID=478107 RepID=A0A9W6RL81_9ACTN|nr:TetR/AcrR family transcriptional regulator [Actinoallomurus iriomotensis]GLY76077.1 TetR family transcriptional regulator [Actinoallomurus iriomotensis]